jgi:aspartate/methionine/tyrosine aminotransferase
MTVWSFCPTQIKNELTKVQVRNKGDQEDLRQYRAAWVDWIKNFSGAETKKQWAVTNGIHDAIANQLTHVHKKFDKVYWFDSDYQFYRCLVDSYNYERIPSNRLDLIQPNSYVIVSQPNHEGCITPWFTDLIDKCQSNGSKIFLDCAFYGCTFDKLDTSLEVFDAVAFSLSKNFLLGGVRAGIVFSDSLPNSLTVPIGEHFGYSYYNILAVEVAKHILPKFDANYVARAAKPIQEEYCRENNLSPADIWMWAFDSNCVKICITDYICNDIQWKLDNDTI